MLDGRGEDRLVWNPYLLEQLTEAEAAHTAFIACLTAGGACDKLRVKLPLLERQSVNVLPVISRCRDNFKNKQWDPAVLTLGLFTREQWLQAPNSLRERTLDVPEVRGKQLQFQRALRYIYIYLYACVRMYMYIDIYLHIFIYIYMHVHLYIFIVK